MLSVLLLPERSKHVTMISSLVLIWWHRECWAVWCAIVLGFVASPLLTAVQVQEGDDIVLLEKLTRHIMVSSLQGARLPAWSLKSQVRLQVSPQGW